jgi:hypothetical protein
LDNWLEFYFGAEARHTKGHSMKGSSLDYLSRLREWLLGTQLELKEIVGDEINQRDEIDDDSGMIQYRNNLHNNLIPGKPQKLNLQYRS